MDVAAWCVKIENDYTRQVILVRRSVSGIDAADSDIETDPDPDSADTLVDVNVEPVNLMEVLRHLCEREGVIDELTDQFEMVVIV